MNRPSDKLLKPSVAVADYFEDLLQHQDQKAPAKPLDVEAPDVLLSGLAAELAEIDTLPTVEAADEQDATPPASSRPEPVADSRRSGKDPSSPSAPLQRSLEFPLQCLMFRVQDSELSVPLVDMGAVVPWTDSLTHLPQSPDWLLGLLQHRDRNVRVVDTARLLSVEQSASEAGHDHRHILVFADQQWAITCDHLGEVIYLRENDVQWNPNALQGLSLGAIRQSLAMLLNPLGILQRLNEQGAQALKHEHSTAGP